MKILVTGHHGYIGSVLTPMLQETGHSVTGLDSYLYEGCDFGDPVPDVPSFRVDIRDVDISMLSGFDAVVHLAGLCNDPLGDLNPRLTTDINHLASVRLARMSKMAGVSRFVFSSSCSIYGASGDEMVTEETPTEPLTPYGHSKIWVEEDVSGMADDDFTPTFLRNATVYGLSPRLRSDLVVNNLVGYAFTTGEIHIKSDGTPWRPLAHVADIAQAFRLILEAPRGVVHNQIFNVGSAETNYQMWEVADIVADVVQNSRITYAADAGPDRRCYKADFSKIAKALPDFQPRWTVRTGVEALYEAFQRYQ
ncbi:MAG: NAD-dependent epimerase/dehydratase family protein, partial [Acidimicrobiia bacterium]